MCESVSVCECVCESVCVSVCVCYMQSVQELEFIF